MTEPFLRYVDDPAPRDRPADLPTGDPAALQPTPDPSPRAGTAQLVLLGAMVLLLGFAALSAANFVSDQFARAPWLGWFTLAVTLLGFALLLTGITRELRALWVLDHVDALRADLHSADPARVMRAARAYAARAPGAAALLPALQAVNDPDAALALLRAGPARDRRLAADALGRAAAIQAVAGIAAVPSPALDALFVAWRGTRLVRQVAALHGVRPGLLATLGLLRRTALSATAVGALEIAGNTLAHGLFSSPLLAKLAGDAAGAAVAARRMLVLSRAAAAACDPVPPE